MSFMSRRASKPYAPRRADEATITSLSLRVRARKLEDNNGALTGPGVYHVFRMEAAGIGIITPDITIPQFEA